MKVLQEDADKERERQLLKEKGESTHHYPRLSWAKESGRFIQVLFITEQEKKREAKQREREAREREAQKKKKAETKEKKRKEYQAQLAAQTAQEQQKKKKEEKKKNARQNQGESNVPHICDRDRFGELNITLLGRGEGTPGTAQSVFEPCCSSQLMVKAGWSILNNDRY